MKRVESPASGSRASSILKAAKEWGLSAKGLRKDTDGLESLKLPYIVFWNFNHFVVVEGFAPGKVFLNDPGFGRKEVSTDEFDQAFTGVVLYFEKTPTFKPGGPRFALLKSLAGRLEGNRSALLFAVLATLSLALPNLIIPTFSRIYFDDFLIGGNAKWLHPLMIAMFLTIAFKALCTQLQQRSLLRMETRLALSSSARYFWHVLRMPIEFFSQRSSGDISSRIQLNDRVASLLSGELANNLVNLMLIGFYAALMLQYDVVLTELSLFVAFLNLIALRYVSRRLVANSRQLLKARGRLTSATMAGLQMIETVKSTGSENDCFAQWAGNQVKVVSAEQHRGTSSQLLSGVPTLLTGLNSIAVLALGGLRVMNGFLSIGMLLAFQELVHSFVEPVHKIVDLGVSFQEAQVSLARLDDALNYPVAPHMRDVALAPAVLPEISQAAGGNNCQQFVLRVQPLRSPFHQGLQSACETGTTSRASRSFWERQIHDRQNHIWSL